jgi:type IV secretory pathway VirB10-like protein
MALKPAAKNILIVIVIFAVCSGAYLYFTKTSGESQIMAPTTSASPSGVVGEVPVAPLEKDSAAVPQNLDLGIKSEPPAPAYRPPVEAPKEVAPTKVKTNKPERAPAPARQTDTPKRSADPFSSVGNL